MARYCLLPPGFRAEALGLDRCRAGSHLHLSSAELREMRDLNLIEVNENGSVAWLREPDPRRHIRGAVRLARRLAMRGLSARVGEVLAAAVYRREPWALVMLAQIRGRIEARGKIADVCKSEFGNKMGTEPPEYRPKP